MKRIVAVLLLAIMLLGLTACAPMDDTTYGELLAEQSGFCLIEELSSIYGTTIYRVYDPNTMVEYLFSYKPNEGVAICPYYNSDGTVAIYNGK